MRILHLSDLHIGFRGSVERVQTLVRNAVTALTPMKEHTVIVVTGDIVENPLVCSFARAEHLLAPLESACVKMLYCPGNHDYGIGWFNIPALGRSFVRTFCESDTNWPRNALIGDTAFIGLDSNRGELGWFDRWGPGGELGEEQLTKLKLSLRRPDIVEARHRVVYLHHHPDDAGRFMGLKDCLALQDILLAGRVDCVLHGHRHLKPPVDAGPKPGIPGILRVYDGGAALHKPKYPRGLHRLIDLDNAPGLDYDLKLLG